MALDPADAAPSGLLPGYCSPQQRDLDGSRALFRTRKPNWTEPETLLLVALVDKHCILRSRLMDYNTNQQKTEVWCTITALINQRNSTVLRTVDEVKRRWQNVYSIAKREASEFHLAVKNKAPHMSSPQLHQFLCPISMRLVDVFGGIDNFTAQQHQQQNGAINIASDTGSSDRISVDSCPAPPVMPELSPHPQRVIKREAGSGEQAEPPLWDRRSFSLELCSPPSVSDFSAAPLAKQARIDVGHAATQTEAENEEQRVRMEMLRMERDLLLLRVERARVRLERDRMRVRMEEQSRGLKLERLKQQSERKPEDSSS